MKPDSSDLEQKIDTFNTRLLNIPHEDKLKQTTALAQLRKYHEQYRKITGKSYVPREQRVRFEYGDD